jgi:hypothetical protein
MFSPRPDAPLSVQVPSAAHDRPSWTKVSVITAIGFIAGVVWPKVAGVRLGPALPESAVASAAASAPPEGASEAPAAGNAPTAAPAVVASAVIATAVPSSPSSSATAPGAVSVSVGHGAVFACKTADGDSLKANACGSLPGLDNVLMPRLRKLAECPEAATASGVLHLVVHPDFAHGNVGVELGRGQGVSAPEPLLACSKNDLAGASLAAIPHDNPRYSVSYRVTFGGGGAASGASASARADSAPAAPSMHGPRSSDSADGAGAAEVIWEVALVRDAPKTGSVIARLPRGTAVRVGPVKDGWYPVHYGDGFAGDGWVYRAAIGR